MLRYGVITLAVALMSGCANQSIPQPTPEGEEVPPGYRYSMVKDKLPDNVRDVSDVPNAVPRREPYSRSGNGPIYEVWGKSYHVMGSHTGFKETGEASWYGAKFHGHKTSNGEIYDMYAMSAAHKHLPIPSFASVTNLDNGKKVIVRVNDRGPFHTGRVIDLSYAAAYKLDMLKKGTARVKVESIHVYPSGAWTVPDFSGDAIESEPMDPESMAPEATPQSTGLRLQIGAFTQRQGAERVVGHVQSMGINNADIVYQGGVHKVLIGPFNSEYEGKDAMRELAEEGMAYFWVR